MITRFSKTIAVVILCLPPLILGTGCTASGDWEKKEFEVGYKDKKEREKQEKRNVCADYGKKLKSDKTGRWTRIRRQTCYDGTKYEFRDGKWYKMGK